MKNKATLRMRPPDTFDTESTDLLTVTLSGTGGTDILLEVLPNGSHLRKSNPHANRIFHPSIQNESHFVKIPSPAAKEWIPVIQIRYPTGYIVSGCAIGTYSKFIDNTKIDAKGK